MSLSMDLFQTTPKASRVRLLPRSTGARPATHPGHVVLQHVFQIAGAIMRQQFLVGLVREPKRPGHVRRFLPA